MLCICNNVINCINCNLLHTKKINLESLNFISFPEVEEWNFIFAKAFFNFKSNSRAQLYF